MHLVYSKASTVQIWLGDAHENTDAAFRFIAEIATCLDAQGHTASYAHLDGYFPGTVQSRQNPMQDQAIEGRRLMQGISHLANMP